MNTSAMHAIKIAASLDPASIQELARAYCGPGPTGAGVLIDLPGQRAIILRPSGPASEPVVARLAAIGLLDGDILTQSGRRALQILVAAMLIDGATP